MKMNMMNGNDDEDVEYTWPDFPLRSIRKMRYYHPAQCDKIFDCFKAVIIMSCIYWDFIKRCFQRVPRQQKTVALFKDQLWYNGVAMEHKGTEEMT